MNAVLLRVAGSGLLFPALSVTAEEAGKIKELQRDNVAQEGQLAAQQRQIGVGQEDIQAAVPVALKPGG